MAANSRPASSPAAGAIRRALVLGGGDVGSAVAHVLFRHGMHVLISERAHSAHARRGMAFTDALYDGAALLDGVQARWQPDVAGVLACWSAGEAVPIVTIPEPDLLATLSFNVLIEATMRRASSPPDLRPVAALVIGVGPGQAPGINCHIAIESQWGENMGSVLREQPAAARSGGPRALAGVTRERFVAAPSAGAWRTRAQLGQSVAAGDILGEINGVPLRAPIAGTLRGLSRDGVQVHVGQRVLEVDPRPAPEIHGLGERPRAIAAGVAAALGLD